VALLWAAGHVTAALELEDLWNDLARRTPFSLYCSYPSSLMEAPEVPSGSVCELHTRVIGVVPGRAGNSSTVEERFSADLLAPRQARRFVIGVLERWGVAHLVDDAALVVSELATNAVMHAASHFTVGVKAGDDAVRISVTDYQPARPVASQPPPMSESGRGLSLVASLARGWGTHSVAGGKVVWAELAL